ncbi:MAG: flagellar hook-associated protein FlgK [Armatimonadetes bacterium]|nr:flagellar hook-associated protein FlgK [Armatimonadota bacterium]
MSIKALQIASSALSAQRATIEVVSHNIANVNTPGFIRRSLLLSPVPGEQNLLGVSAGRGVTASGIRRMSDALLEAQIEYETGRWGRSSVLCEDLEQVELLVAGPDGTGLRDQLNAFFDAFGEIASDPGAAAPRQLAVSTAQDLCDSLSERVASLHNAIQSGDDVLVSQTARINELLEQIAQFNTQITAGGGPGTAADLEDRRSLSMQELAQLCGATGAVRDNGTMDVFIGGHHVVSYGRSEDLELVPDPTWGTLHTVSLKGEVPPSGMDGAVLGALESRHTILRALADLDAFAVQLADAVNAVHRTGYGLDNSTGRDFFSCDPAQPGATLAVHADIMADPSRIASASAADQPGDGSAASALEALRTNPPSGGTSSLTEVHTQFLSRLGQDVQIARTRMEARADLVAALQTRYSSTAGVSLDEEALHLAIAQDAYLAAQKAAQLALEIIDMTLTIGE